MKSKTIVKLAMSLAFTALAAACSGPDSDVTEQPPETDTSAAEAPAAPKPEPKTLAELLPEEELPENARPVSQVDAAEGAAADEEPKSPQEIAMLVARKHTGLSERQTIVIMVVQVDFPSPALGCPDPDMSYPAVITPGYKAQVKAGGERLDIRISGQTGFVCEGDDEEETPDS